MLVTKFVPAAEPASKRLMMVLHGLGDSMAGYAFLPQMLNLPWMNYLMVNAPDPYYGGFSWYDFAADPAPGVVRSRQLLFDLLDEQRKQGWPTEQTIPFGFSQGCLMVWELGLRSPQLFAGLVGISGYAHEPEAAFKELSPVAKQQRFLITHGTLDNLIPFPQVRAQVEMLKKTGLQIEWHEFRKDHTIAGDEEIEVIRNFVRTCYSL